MATTDRTGTAGGFLQPQDQDVLRHVIAELRRAAGESPRLAPLFDRVAQWLERRYDVGRHPRVAGTSDVPAARGGSPVARPHGAAALPGEASARRVAAAFRDEADHVPPAVAELWRRVAGKLEHVWLGQSAPPPLSYDRLTLAREVAAVPAHRVRALVATLREEAAAEPCLAQCWTSIADQLTRAVTALDGRPGLFVLAGGR